MTRPHVELTYDWIDALIRHHESALRKEGFQAVVGILRGGTVPAFMAAQMLDCPLHFLNYSRGAETVAWDNQTALPGARLLLVDDIAGMGVTLTNCRKFLVELGYEVKTLVIGFDARSRSLPDFGKDFGDQTILFPWEPHRLNPAFVRDLERGQYLPDGNYARAGWDLDGILLSDLPDEEYARDLMATLKARDELLPHGPEHLPPSNHPASPMTIITARPLSDFERTRLWLNRHGFSHFKLVCRDPEKYDYPDSARFKADMCRQEGVTHFYESDLLQATLISHYAPLLKVYCWNKDRGLRILIGPAKVIE